MADRASFRSILATPFAFARDVRGTVDTVRKVLDDLHDWYGITNAHTVLEEEVERLRYDARTHGLLIDTMARQRDEAERLRDEARANLAEAEAMVDALHTEVYNANLAKDAAHIERNRVKFEHASIRARLDKIREASEASPIEDTVHAVRRVVTERNAARAELAKVRAFPASIPIVRKPQRPAEPAAEPTDGEGVRDLLDRWSKGAP